MLYNINSTRKTSSMTIYGGISLQLRFLCLVSQACEIPFDTGSVKTLVNLLNFCFIIIHIYLYFEPYLPVIPIVIVFH